MLADFLVAVTTISSSHRSHSDKRVVHATLTEEGEAKIATAPKPLQDVFQHCV